MKRATSATWPFTYETNREVIRETLERYDGQLAVERGMVLNALRRRDRKMAVNVRRQIDRLETVRRAGLTRLRRLGEDA